MNFFFFAYKLEGVYYVMKGGQSTISTEKILGGLLKW